MPKKAKSEEEKRIGRPRLAGEGDASSYYKLAYLVSERVLWEKAAEIEGVSLAQWMRDSLNRAAKRST